MKRFTFNGCLMVLLLVAMLVAPVAAKRVFVRDNPYRPAVITYYKEAMSAYRSLMQLYGTFPIDNRRLFVAYYSYTRVLATYKTAVARYEQWEREHGDDEQTPRLETKRVRIERDTVYRPAVVPNAETWGILTEESITRSITLQVGQQLKFSLETNASTGYSWSSQLSNSACVTLTKAQGSTDDEPRYHILGASSRLDVTLTGRKQGTCVLTMTYRRAWEPKVAPVRTLRIAVTVGTSPDNTVSGSYSAVENGNSRSRRTYRVTSTSAHLVASHAGRAVLLTGRYENGETPYVGTVHVTAVQVLSTSSTSSSATSSEEDLPTYDDVIYSY